MIFGEEIARMYWNILDNKRIELLREIVKTISLNNYYMVGGTALSLQLNLRESFDFDFCTSDMFNSDVLLSELKSIGNTEVKQNQKGTIDVLLDGVQVSFFFYPNNLVENIVKNDEIPNLRMASILDIAAMKVAAIGGRGAKKDFFDLYNIMKKCNIDTEKLASAVIKKFGTNVNYVNMIMGLSYFEDAESEELPKTFVEYDWNTIKKHFIDIQPEFQVALEKYL